MSSKKGSEDGANLWRYVVLLAKFVIQFIFMGISKSLAVLIPSLVVQFNLDYASAGFLVSLEYGMVFLVCPIANLLTKMVDARTVATTGATMVALSLIAATFSVTFATLACLLFLTGLFSSPLRLIPSTKLREHFEEKYGLAETISHFGTNVGGIAMSFITATCHEVYGLRGAILILGALSAHLIPFAYCMKSPSQRNAGETSENLKQNYKVTRTGGGLCKSKPVVFQTQNEDENSMESQALIQSEPTHNSHRLHQSRENLLEQFPKPVVHQQYEQDENSRNMEEDHHSNTIKERLNMILTSLSYVFDVRSIKDEPILTFIVLPCQFLLEASLISCMFFMVTFGESIGLSKLEAVYLPMAANFGAMLGRVVVTCVLYKRNDLAPHIFAASCGIASVSLLTYDLNSSLTYLILCSSFAGLGFYNGLSTGYPVIALVVKKENFAGAMSYSFFLSGIGILFAGPLTGFLYDVTGSFELVFQLIGIVMAFVFLYFSSYILVETLLRKKTFPIG